MFRGIVEAVGKIRQCERLHGGARFYLEIPPLLTCDLRVGSSVAVNGACLTIAGWREECVFWTELSSETLEKTYFDKCRVGDEVNLERALKVSDRLDGHWVTGHIDTVGTVLDVTSMGDFTRMTFGLPDVVCRDVIQKGSIAVDGVSLTVNQVRERSVEAMIIPETLKKTTLGRKKVGDWVQVELDLIGKYVKKWMKHD